MSSIFGGPSDGAPSESASTIEELRSWSRYLKAVPPPVSRIIARHDVPYGRAFRMWTTRGDLIVYANRGEMHDLPHAPKKSNPLAAYPIASFGIPVVFE
jgi:hypothetical protein